MPVALGIYFMISLFGSVGPLLQDLERDVYLVVDTGLHAMGWSVEQAAEFITNNTVLKANSSMVNLKFKLGPKLEVCNYFRN